jgi:diacylglycerol O-acyltransferase
VARLSALSSAFLDVEDVDSDVALVIGSCGVLDGPAPRVAELRAHVARRLVLAPRYRQRVRTAPLDLRAPAWEDAPGLDVADHVRERAVPAPAGDAELAAVLGEVMGERMDRSRPLWDVTVLTGLPDDRWGLVCRVHHALADGVSGTALLRLVYDGLPHGGGPPVGLAPEASWTGALGSAVHALRGGLHLGGALVPVHGPSVLGTIRTGRRYDWRRLTLEDARGVRVVLGVSVNDVVLAAVAGGFRDLLLHRGLEPHPRAVRSLVPVSTWSTPAPGEPDNRVTLLLVDLPVHLPSAAERVLAVHGSVNRLRGAGEPEAGLWAQRLLSLAPRVLLGPAVRLAWRMPQHQVATVTTNVPGPTEPLGCLGRPVRHLLPYVPIADRIQVGVAAFSYCGELTIGFSADRDVEDLEVLASGTAQAWAELAGTFGPPPG